MLIKKLKHMKHMKHIKPTNKLPNGYIFASKTPNRVGNLCRCTLAAGHAAEVAAVFTGGMAMPLVMPLSTATILNTPAFPVTKEKTKSNENLKSTDHRI